MGVGVCHVDAGEGKAHPVHAIQALHVASQLLPQVQDVAGQVRRHVLEIGIVLLGNDERVAGPHRLDVQERQQAVILVQDVGGNLAAGDAAEQAIVGHAGLCLIMSRRA